jgi:hypothetical protein
VKAAAVQQDVANHPSLFACVDCGQIHWVSNRVAAAMILFGLANGLTLFEISFVGDHRNAMIISGAIQLSMPTKLRRQYLREKLTNNDSRQFVGAWNGLI